MTTQPQVRVHGPLDVRIDDVVVPEVGPRDVLVRVVACGISSDDLRRVACGGPEARSGHPMPLGCEVAGVVERAGERVRDVAIGARVVVDPSRGGRRIGTGGSEGGLTPRLLVRDAAEGGCLVPVADALPLPIATLASPLGVAMRAIHRLAVRPGERVLVSGAGTIGLAAVAALVYRGVDDVVVVDRSERRLAIAREVGARATLDRATDPVWSRLRELHGDSLEQGTPLAGSDAYIDVGGDGLLISELVSHAKPGARIAIVGPHADQLPVHPVALKELELFGSSARPDDWTEVMEMLCRVDLAPLVTHRYPLERIHEALAVAGDAARSGRVVIEIAGSAPPRFR